jgi:hypothetical protein
MASKKDKGKGKIDSKALVLKPESTLASSSSISLVDLANRFHLLAQNYQFLIPVL